MNLIRVFVLMAAFIGLAMATSVPFRACDVNDCEIHDVVVDGCTQSNANAACTLKRRKPSHMSFDYTAPFDAETLEASLVWVNNDNELPLASMDKDACKYTTCPVKNAEKQNYSIDIPIESKFPLGAFTIKWTLKAPSGKQCCFMHDIKLVR